VARDPGGTLGGVGDVEIWTPERRDCVARRPESRDEVVRQHPVGTRDQDPQRVVHTGAAHRPSRA
jgi:hypothetical protein